MFTSSGMSIASQLLKSYQRGFPLVAEPFAEIAHQIGASEAAVCSQCNALMRDGVIARIGGVVRPNTIAASTRTAVGGGGGHP